MHEAATTEYFAPENGQMTTEDRLLAAAEALIAEQGLHAVRTRPLAARAGLNMGMIRYCFGGIDQLVLRLLELNLGRFIEEQSRLERALTEAASREQILFALLAPNQTPAAFVPGIRAAAIIEDIMVHFDDRAKREAEAKLHMSYLPLLDRLIAACPHLSREAVLWRFCCVCAGSLSFSPRAPAWQLYNALSKHDPATGEQALAELIAVAAGALAYQSA